MRRRRQPPCPPDLPARARAHPLFPPTSTVTLNKNLGGGSKCLLQGVSGIAVPGRLTALMGASGAGKSTLLDVIAGRKTAGAMEGAIFLNGFPREPRSFARLTAYCEQADIHHSFATVGEALAFSAALRLPAAVDGATRRAYVAEVTELLELRGIASRLIGDVGAANGLSPGQRKILTIAVELVSNAPILFLDEPTSGARRPDASRTRCSAAPISPSLPLSPRGRTPDRAPPPPPQAWTRVPRRWLCARCARSRTRGAR